MTGLSRRHWAGIFLGGLLLLPIYRFAEAWTQAPAYVNRGSFDRVSWWLLSSRCAKATGSFLTICGRRNELYPLEDFLLADDRGYSLAGCLLAQYAAHPITRETFIHLNLAINALGLLALCGVCRLGGLDGTVIALLALGGYYAIPGHVPFPGPDASYVGIFALALVAPLWTVLWMAKPMTPSQVRSGHLLAVFCITLAWLFRQPLGAIGSLTSCGVVICFLAVRGASRIQPSLLAISFGVLALILSSQASAALLALRDQWFPVRPASHLQTHGFGHVLLVSWTTQEDPSDLDAEALVEKARPGVVHYSAAYDRTAWRLYLSLCFKHPKTSVHIYLSKFLRMLRLPLPVFSLPIWLWLGVLPGLFAWGFLRMPPAYNLFFELAGAAYVASLLVLAQGVLAQPWYEYMYPARFGTSVALCCLAECGWGAYVG